MANAFLTTGCGFLGSWNSLNKSATIFIFFALKALEEEVTPKDCEWQI